MIYKVGLAEDEVSEETLKKSILSWERVSPRQRIVSLAQTLLDVPYKFGASVSKDAPLSFDCSSFTAYLYVQAGVALPRICNDQYNFGQKISEAEAEPGDLVFFKGQRTDIPAEAVGHCALYIGDGEIIHAGGVSIGYGKVLRERILESKYYPTGFMGYYRLLPSEAERFVVEIPETRPDLRDKNKLIDYLNA